MGDDVVSTEGQMSQEEGMKMGTGTAENPGASHHQSIQSFSLGGAVHTVTDGHVPVIGHHNEGEIIDTMKSI